ncbi:Delta-1-pyrroline-5-carboxylate dehydrogenase [Trichinella spiralis]|uniref:Delta-1-pyrroline-5-carboxylate dehydrogenase n=1 Tax=Trichinella spiralis TaxID=6334 RepID=A0ABR3KXG8_TRISP
MLKRSMFVAGEVIRWKHSSELELVRLLFKRDAAFIFARAASFSIIKCAFERRGLNANLREPRPPSTATPLLTLSAELFSTQKRHQKTPNEPKAIPQAHSNNERLTV